MTFGIACDGVRLVDDEEVPGIVRQRLDDVPLFHEVERRDPHTRPAPRVLAVGAPPRHCVQLVAIGRAALDPESTCELGRPLVPQRRRYDDERPCRGRSPVKLRDRETGLNRLAESDLVGKEHSSRAAQHRDRRFELIGQDVDGRVDRAADGGDREGPADQIREPRQCMTCTDAAQPLHSIDRRRSVERRKKRQPLITAPDVDPDDVAVAARALHPPAPLANPDDVSRHGHGDVHFLPTPSPAAIARNATARRNRPCFARERR